MGALCLWRRHNNPVSHRRKTVCVELKIGSHLCSEHRRIDRKEQGINSISSRSTQHSSCGGCHYVGKGDHCFKHRSPPSRLDCVRMSHSSQYFLGENLTPGVKLSVNSFVAHKVCVLYDAWWHILWLSLTLGGISRNVSTGRNDSFTYISYGEVCAQQEKQMPT